MIASGSKLQPISKLEITNIAALGDKGLRSGVWIWNCCGGRPGSKFIPNRQWNDLNGSFWNIIF